MEPCIECLSDGPSLMPGRVILVPRTGQCSLLGPVVNTAAVSPGGLAFHAAAMMSDVLFVFGGLRQMRFDSSNELWAFTFAAYTGGTSQNIAGAWRKVNIDSWTTLYCVEPLSCMLVA